jgi:hypothetical protein
MPRLDVSFPKNPSVPKPAAEIKTSDDPTALLSMLVSSSSDSSVLEPMIHRSMSEDSIRESGFQGLCAAQNARFSQ